MAVAVLMLQAFAQHGGAAGGAAHQEALAARVGEGPGHVSDALEAEHGVVHVEGNRRHTVVGVGRACGGKRGHGAGFGDAFFEDLAVLLFAVAEQHVGVVRGVLLAFGGVDADLLDHRFEAEGAAFVGNDGDDQLADRGILQQMAQHADEAHGGGDGAVVGAAGPLLEGVERRGLEVDLRDLALGQVAAQLLAARVQVLDLGRVVVGTVEGAVLRGLLRERECRSA